MPLSFALNHGSIRDRATYLKLRIEADAAIAANRAKLDTFHAVERATTALQRLEYLWLVASIWRRHAQDRQLGRCP